MVADEEDKETSAPSYTAQLMFALKEISIPCGFNIYDLFSQWKPTHFHCGDMSIISPSSWGNLALKRVCGRPGRLEPYILHAIFTQNRGSKFDS